MGIYHPPHQEFFQFFDPLLVRYIVCLHTGKITLDPILYLPYLKSFIVALGITYPLLTSANNINKIILISPSAYQMTT